MHTEGSRNKSTNFINLRVQVFWDVSPGKEFPVFQTIIALSSSESSSQKRLLAQQHSVTSSQPESSAASLSEQETLQVTTYLQSLALKG